MNNDTLRAALSAIDWREIESDQCREVLHHLVEKAQIGPELCPHFHLLGSVIDKTEPLTCTGCGATVGRDGVVIQG